MGIPAYRIFISSPGDVGREREMARKVCARVEGRLGGRLKIEPYFWEEVPMLATRGDFQQQITEPAEFDLMVCILWSRLGSRLHPGKHKRADGSEYASGTEYEFESAARAAQAKGKPDLLVYRRTETPLFPPEPEEEDAARRSQWKALKEFCRRWFVDQHTGAFQVAFNQYQDLAEFEEKLESHLLTLARRHLGAGGTASSSVVADQAPAWTQGSPYRGLQVFEMEHEPVFFGRTKARDDVLGALRARVTEERRPFVLLFGASGSGKSSLLRAGVLPWLIRPGVIEGVDRWRWVLWRPSETPVGGDLLDGLAHALLSPDALPELGADGTDAHALAAMLRQSPEGAGGLLKGALSQAAAEWQRREKLSRQPVVRLALGVDQLEEAFTAAERFSTEGRAQFFRVLSALAGSGFAWIVATLRSDFYARCEEHPELVALKQGRGQYHLLPPSAAELSQMIRLPAEAAGVEFEEHPEKGRLEDALRDEALAEPGALPLLEYALDELYRAGAAGGRLTHAEHARLGGVGGALARRAEETFVALPVWAQASLDGVLRQLVRLGEGDDEVAVRRTAPHAAVTAGAGAKELVEAFLEARLLVGDQDTGGERTVTVAHESLLRSWPRVEAWIKANRDFLRVRARLGFALARWDSEQRNADFLLPAGRPLAEAEDLLAKHSEALAPAEQEYILASVAKREAAARGHRRALRTVAATFAALAAVAGWQWWDARQQSAAALTSAGQARIQTVKAETETRRATELLAEAARNDATEAGGHFARGERSRALAQLARSLRYDAAGPAAMSAMAFLQDGRPQPPVTFLLGHTEMVRRAAFSPDGTRVATASYDKTARLWDARSGQPLGEPMRHEGPLAHVAFSPDGTRVVTASGDKTARLWDATTGKPLSEPMRHEGAVIHASFSPDGARVVTASMDKTARLWDATTGKPLGEPLRHEGTVNEAFFSPDGRSVVTASDDKTARLWDAQDGHPLGEPLRHEDEVRGAAFSPDGARVATASSDKTARLWNAQDGHAIGEPMRHESTVWSAKFSPDGGRLVTASTDGTARLWNAPDGHAIGEPMRHEGMVWNAVFSPDGARIVTASFDKTARLWDGQSGKSLGEPLRHAGIVWSALFSPDGSRVLTMSKENTPRLWDTQPRNPLGEPLRHADWVWGAVFSPDGSRIATACMDKTARLWDARSGQPLGEPIKHDGAVTSVAFSPDGRRLLTASYDKTARLWDAQDGHSLGEPLRHADGVTSAAFSPDGTRVVTSSWDKTARVWDARSGQPLGEPLRHGDKVFRAAFSPEGDRVITASGDSTARVWDARTGQPLGEPLRHVSTVWGVAFSPDGARVATASGDQTARLWDARSGKPLGAPMPHEGMVYSVAFSPDGRRVLTAGLDKTARLWDAQSGKPIGEPWRHEGKVFSAAFSPDGLRAITASDDGTARQWLLPPPDVGPAPGWFSTFLRWRAQARLDENGAFRYETGEEQAATRKELFDALAAVPAGDTSFYVQFARRFAPEGSLARGR